MASHNPPVWTSPVSYQEQRFLAFWVKLNIPYILEPQYQIGPYYADFAHPESRTIIEIDGKAYHTSPEQVERDQHRQAYLEAECWTVLRFTGSQIQRDPVRSVYQAKNAISSALVEASCGKST